MSAQQIELLKEKIQAAYECRDWEQYYALLSELLHLNFVFIPA